MRTCSTNVARSMGYLNTPSVEEKFFPIIGAPRNEVGRIETFHEGGVSHKEQYLMAKRNLKTIFGSN